MTLRSSLCIAVSSVLLCAAVWMGSTVGPHDDAPPGIRSRSDQTHTSFQTDTTSAAPRVDGGEFRIQITDDRFKLEPPDLDLGTGAGGSTIKRRILVRNDSDIPIAIDDVVTTCGCTAAVTSDSEIEPGSRISLDISMKLPSEPGKSITKRVQFVVKGSDTPISLRVSARTRDTVVLTPATIDVNTTDLRISVSSTDERPF